MTDLPTYTLERDFDAPAALVWRTWTEKDLLSHWYGPGVETVIHELDVRPGGVWLNEMRMKSMSDFQKADYLEVEPPSKLVWIHSTCDENWQPRANPMMADWPKQLLTTVTFEEADGKTRMRLTWVPHEASATEIACFEGAIAGMGKGWGAGMDLLEEILAELQA